MRDKENGEESSESDGEGAEVSHTSSESDGEGAEVSHTIAQSLMVREQR